MVTASMSPLCTPRLGAVNKIFYIFLYRIVEKKVTIVFGSMVTSSPTLLLWT